jgi:hypothetical protein
MGLCEGIGTAALQAKAIRVTIGLGFRDGIEAQQVEGLHGSIGHGRNSKTAAFAVAFGNVHPAERLRSITVPSQSAERGRLGFRCVPEDSVHTGSLRTRITSMSPPTSSPDSFFLVSCRTPLVFADDDRLESTAGFPGSPSSVRRGTQRFSLPLGPVISLVPWYLPAWSVSRVLSGWWPRRKSDRLGSVLTSIRVDQHIRSSTR